MQYNILLSSFAQLKKERSPKKRCRSTGAPFLFHIKNAIVIIIHLHKNDHNNILPYYSERERTKWCTATIMANNDKVHIVTCYYFTDRRKTKAKNYQKYVCICIKTKIILFCCPHINLQQNCNHNHHHHHHHCHHLP